MWHGLLTMPTLPTGGLQSGARSWGSGFRNRRRRGAVGRPCHNVACHRDILKRQRGGYDMKDDIVASRGAMPAFPSLLLLVDRRSARDRLHNLDILDLLLVYGVRIVCQDDEVGKLAGRYRSLDPFFV